MASGAASYPGVAGAVAAHKAARVGQHLAPGGRVKAAAVGVGDARIGGESRGLSPPRPLDALRPRERVDIVVEKVQIARDGTEFGRLRQAGEGVFLGDFGQRQRAVTSWRMPSAVRSLVEAEADRVPRKTRSPARASRIP
jgi:hypothetical protein